MSENDQKPRATTSKQISLYGWLTLAVYVGFAAFFSYFPGLHVPHKEKTLVLVPGLVILLYAYWRIAFLLSADSVSHLKRIIFFGLAASLIATCVKSFDSNDLRAYISNGWAQARYATNPYVTPAVRMPAYKSDQVLHYDFADRSPPYGFLFTHMTRGVAALGQGNFDVTLGLFKTVSWLAYAGLGAAIYFASRRFGAKRPDLSLYLFLLNPLILLQTLSNGHNDLLMALPMVLSFFALSFAHFELAMVLLVAGGLIKGLCLIAAPVLAIFTFKAGGARRALTAVLAALATIGLLAWMYIGPGQNVDVMHIVRGYAPMSGSLFGTVKDVFRAIGPLGGVSAVIVAATGIALTGGFAVFFLWKCARLITRGNAVPVPEIMHTCLLLTSVYVLFISHMFQSWYIAMILPVGLCLPETSKLRKLLLVLASTQLFALTFIGRANMVYFLLLTALPTAVFLTLSNNPALRAKLKSRFTRSSESRTAEHPPHLELVGSGRPE